MSILCIGMAVAGSTAGLRGQDLRLGPGRAKKTEPAPATPKTSKDAIGAGSVKPKTIAGPKEVVAVAIHPQNGESTADAWDALFAAQRAKVNDADFDAGVRAKVRSLVAKQDFSQVQEVIAAALRNNASQPWMYEALALALEASGAPEKEIERAVLSAVDVSRDQDAALTAAAYLASIKLDGAALRLFQEVSSQDPLRTEPYLQGLKCAQKLKDVDAIRWSCVGILKQAWPADQKEIEQHARRIAEATISELEKKGDTKRADAFLAEIASALRRDVVVKVTWTGDADVDLSVMEPTGEVCSYRNPRTTGGGVILGDTFSRSSVTAPRQGFSETFLSPEGFSGQYQVLLKRVWGEVAGGKVNVEAIIHYGSKNARTIKKDISLDKDGTLVKFDLTEGRRMEALPEARAAVATSRQIEVARHVLAQQIPSTGSNSSETYYGSPAKPMFIDPFARLALPVGRGAVGFRPQITTLRDGPVLFAGPAVVSADRRFVRMTLSPQFSTIGDVQTFNFATGAVGNGNGSGNTPGTGGGVGGGGGTGT